MTLTFVVAYGYEGLYIDGDFVAETKGRFSPSEIMELTYGQLSDNEERMILAEEQITFDPKIGFPARLEEIAN